MIFYFNRETGRRVSRSTWARSKSHGGSRYVRRSALSTPKGETKGRGKSADHGKSIAPPPTQGAIGPSETPRTWQDWEKQAREKTKKRGQYVDDFDYDNGVEYETGVDY